MNKAQARKLTMWLNGRWLVLTDTSALPDNGTIGQLDRLRVMNAQDTLGRDLIERSTVPINASFEEACRILRIKL